MTSIEHQRRLNPNLKDVVKKEILKLLDAGVIYPISDSKWVSPVHVVPKKGGITVVKNDKDELIPTRTITGHRMCIDYRKLNSASRKDHFPLPFIDQMLERLANHPFYCFLDGYSGFFQIPIHPNDQEKTTFTCPYGTFAYRRMPFGLCNAPATFQSTPSKKARAPRSHSMGPLVLEKNTKKDAEKPKLPTKIRIKAPNPKQLAPPPLMPVDTTVEEASSPIESEAEQETFEKLGFNPRRDRQRKPTEVELLEQMRQGVSWPPTRFADERLMRELEIDQDIKDLLALMNMDSFYSMAHPTYKEVSCQFLASLEVTFHSSQHEEQGWGRISFKIDGKPYFMTFTEIGEVLGLKDLKESSLPKLKGLPKGKTLSHFTYKFLSGKDRVSSTDKNASIRHPSVRYLHRLIVHTIYPRKEQSNVNGEDLNLMHQAIQHFALPPHLPEVPTDFYAEFEAQIGIGGLITPLLAHQGIDLGDDASGPSFIDLTYLKSAHYFSGRYDGKCVYSYLRGPTTVELLLPNYELTTLSTPGTMSFDISEQHLLGSHGALGPMTLKMNEKAAAKAGPIRQAHDQISALQRWNRAQDRTIFKLTKKCKELRKTVKRQAEASAKFMRKVADVLTKGAVAGCKAEDFDLETFLAPLPLPLLDPNTPQTEKQALRSLRNPYIAPSASGNKSPSLSTTADEDESEGEASASSHAP
ncbi:hypothetical protein Bca101_067604 [Brassica carinata]